MLQSTLKPVTRRRSSRRSVAETLSESAYNAIRHQILHGELEPGSFVSERVLAERIGMGKAPVRSAVQRLAAEGFISIESRRGIMVASQSIQDVVDLFQIRIMIERRVVRAIAGRLRAPQVEQLRANLAEMTDVAKAGVAGEIVTADFEFHRLLCAFHGNKHLSAVFARVLDTLYREVWITHTKFPDRVWASLGEHSELIDIIEQGETEKAEELLVRHLELGEQCVLSRRPSGSSVSHSHS